jgi:hypothetical protein
VTEAVVGGVVGAVVGGLVAAFATWLFRRTTAIERFHLEASGATRALEKAVKGTGKHEHADHLAGVASPLADSLGLRVRRLEEPARMWAKALEDGDLAAARRAQETFDRKARFAGFGL